MMKGWEEVETALGKFPTTEIALYCKQTKTVSIIQEGEMSNSIYWAGPVHKNKAIFDAESELMAVPEGGAIVDIRTGQMVAVNRNCGKWSNLSPEKFKEASSWTRDLYIHPEDREMILREAGQLQVNMQSSFIDLTIRYGDATERRVIKGDDQIIGTVTNRYRVLQDEDGLFWHLGTNIPGSNIPLAA